MQFDKSLLIDVTLSPRQKEIIALVDDGNSTPEIADQLFISPSTVNWTLEEIKFKLESALNIRINKRTKMAKICKAMGWI